MKYICLGYIEPGKFEGMTEDERNAVFDECFEYNDHLRANGHVVAEVPLQPPGRLDHNTASSGCIRKALGLISSNTPPRLLAPSAHRSLLTAHCYRSLLAASM
jgi:hypothetical protein